MRKTVVTVTLVLGLLALVGGSALQAANCMPLSPIEHVYDNIVVYSLNGRGINVTITVNPPENKAHNSSVSFTLKILEPYLRGGGNSVNPGDYFLSQETLDAYLISGVILDYDRVKIIDPLWIYWGQTENATYREEERALFLSSQDVVFSKSEGTYFGNAILPKLSEGMHNLTVWVRAEFNQVTTYDPLWAAISKTITFKIDTVSPNPKFLVPDNSTFKTSEVLLNFTVDEAFSKIEYSLDRQSNVTIGGNTTLTGLPNGRHNVTIYATDEAENTGASETLIFYVDAPEAFPVVPAAAVAVVALVVSGGLLFYFKKRKR
jgi:hypothetical protein